MTTAIENCYIVMDAEGRAWIEGANSRVLQVAADRYAHGWSAEEIHRQHPHLSLAQIHAALSYYYDHQAEMDAEIESDWHLAANIRADSGPSRAEKRLRDSAVLE